MVGGTLEVFKLWFIALCFAAVMLTTQAAATENPREAGARYGQARGAAEVCPGVSVGKPADALKAQFRGSDLDNFNAQAANVYASWRKIKDCVLPTDPNPCRIMIQLSCQSALAEIGPSGSARAHLLEVLPR